MAEELQTSEQTTTFSVQQEGLPGILNILTILTMIGSAVGLIGSFFTGMGCKVLEMDTVVDKMKPEELAMLTATCENQTILMISGIVGGVLCFVGAIMMRQLKQQGFIVYLAGQILPIILGLIALSDVMFNDWKSGIGYAITLLFIGLYNSQRKYLIK